jgi:Zn finger protein HypA/HybF involved in hydrogenase expression
MQQGDVAGAGALFSGGSECVDGADGGTAGGGLMKRLIATRKLKRKCECCQREFLKGDVYYKQRIVSVFDDWVVSQKVVIRAYEYYLCPKCKYKNGAQEQRFRLFREKCQHPKKFIETAWRYIPGECVQEPDYDQCRLCGKKLV